VIPPVRPPMPPSAAPNPAAVRTDPARLAAQRAFFDLALGNVVGHPAAPTAAPQSARAPVQSRSGQIADAPQKTLRPGSLLDIRV